MCVTKNASRSLGMLIVFLLVAANSGAASLPIAGVEPDDTQSSPKITDEWFFVFVKNRDGTQESVRLDSSMPILAVKQVFGCMVEFESVPRKLLLHIKLTGPSAMGRSTVKGGRQSHSADGRSHIIDLEIDGSKGRHGFWFSIDPWDPMGRYELSCTIGAIPSKPWEFEVE